ncbi:MAG TPA: Smr/MutS family protein [Longimicrobiaceae bacterium]|nr:Smr/MutS family protein [Longimicrobiaceae bacterium]
MPRKRRPDPPGEAWGSLWPLLDLHGRSGDEARRQAERWLRARQAEGARTVVVVTGRGNRSAGPPVLRGEIEDLLAALRGTLVSGFSPVDGGGGFRVELRRAPPAAPRAPEPGMAGLDPELRRRAEEALWELGIAPTPALVRAEAERIRREEGHGRPPGEV